MPFEELTLRQDEHSTTLLKTLEGLLKSSVLVDCTLAAEGRFLKAHRIILSSFSPYFQLLFTQDMNKNPIIFFKDIEFKYLKMVLEYMYCGKVRVSQAQLNTFLEVANALQIVGLESKNREVNSEENDCKILDSVGRGNVTQISQQYSEDETDLKSMNAINSVNLTTLDPTTPVQTDVQCLDATSMIHIQSVYTLTSESTSTSYNLVTEDSARPDSNVAYSKCNIKVESMTIDGNRKGRAINTTEQASVSNGAAKRPRNKRTISDGSVQVEHINSSESHDRYVTESGNRTTDSKGRTQSSKIKYTYPDQTHAKQILSDESCSKESVTSHKLKDKHTKKYPFSTGSGIRITHLSNVENASGTTKEENSTEPQYFPKSISQASKVSTHENSGKNLNNISELVGNSKNVQRVKRKNQFPECVVQAERIVIDEYCEENSSSSAQQRKVSKFRIIHPKKDSEKSHPTKDTESNKMAIKEDKSDGTEKALELAASQNIDLPLSTKNSSHTKMCAASGSQIPEGKQSRSNSSQDDKSVVNKSAVLSNFNESPSSSEKTWFCEICDRQMGSKNFAIRHMQVHTGEKPFSCGICNREFSYKNNLDHHERTHSGEKSYTCNVCARSFTQLSTLNRHVLTHSGKRPFKCKFCDMSFLQHNHLVRHLRTHTKEKPFTCNICERRFALKENLVTHIRIHTGEKPYKCKVCKMSFAQHSTLSRHLLTHTA